MIEIYLTGTDRQPPECECCGRTDKLRYLPPLMSGRGGQSDRLICSYCIGIWYDRGITDSVEIGKECRRAEQVGEFPFTKAA